MQLGWRHRLQLVRGCEREVARRLLDPRHVEAVAVVGDFDEQHVSLLLDADDDAAFTVLATRFPHLGHLEAVVHRVPHQRHERTAQRLEDAAVERHLAADDGQSRELPRLLAHVADRAAQRLQHRPDGKRADRLQLLFHRGDDVCRLVAVAR